MENISGYKVLHSPAGWYIGRTYRDNEIGEDLPYDRLSDYFSSAEAARESLGRWISSDIAISEMTEGTVGDDLFDADARAQEQFEKDFEESRGKWPLALLSNSLFW